MGRPKGGINNNHSKEEKLALVKRNLSGEAATLGQIQAFKNRTQKSPLDEFVGIIYAKPVTKFTGVQAPSSLTLISVLRPQELSILLICPGVCFLTITRVTHHIAMDILGQGFILVIILLEIMQKSRSLSSLQKTTVFSIQVSFFLSFLKLTANRMRTTHITMNLMRIICDMKSLLVKISP